MQKLMRSNKVNNTSCRLSKVL